MAKIISWIVLAPLALFIIDFSASNRALVTIELWPMPFTLDIPIFSLALFGAVLGVIFGGAATWFSASTIRTKARAQAQRAKVAENEAANLREKLAQLEEKNAPLPKPQQDTIQEALPAPDKAA